MLDDVPFEVMGWYSPGSADTWEEPGEAEDSNIYHISLSGEQLSQKQETFLIEKYGFKDFCDWLMDAGREAYEEEKTKIAIDKAGGM